MKSEYGGVWKVMLGVVVVLCAWEMKVVRGEVYVDQLSVVATGHSSYPTGFTEYNGMLYFSANTGTNGAELMRTSGAGVSLVADIFPGTTGSSPGSFAVFSNILYFAATDGTNGRELWRYNGTTATLVTNLAPGSASSNPQSLTVYNGALYFSATDGFYGNELWRYDGVSITRVTDIALGGASSNPQNLRVFNGILYFTATDASGTEFWQFDGATVSMVADIAPGPTSSSPQYLTVYNGALYFAANDGSTGNELWRHNGATVSLVTNIAPGAASSNPQYLAVYNGNLYFSANNGVSGTELWRFNGTTAAMVTNLNPGTGHSYPQFLTVYSNRLFFAANDSYTTSGTHLWQYDGTNVTLAAQIENPGSGAPQELTVFAGALYFSAYTSLYGRELWKHIADSGAAYNVANIYPYGGNFDAQYPCVFSNTLYFTANGDENNYSFWKYDGTNTSRISSIHPNGQPQIYNGQLYFNYANNLWRFGGGTNFTQITNPAFSDPTDMTELTVFNGALYFSGYEYHVGYELWRYNGTNTTRVTDINTNGTINANSYPTYLTVFNGALYFRAYDGYNYGLWRYNGSTTSRIVSNCYPEYLTVYNNALYYLNSTDLCRYDGVSAPQIVYSWEFIPSTGYYPTVFNGALYLTAYDSTYGTELWKYDGSTMTRVTDINPGNKNSNPQNLTGYNGALYFSAGDGTVGQLWRYDGTQATRVTDINRGAGGTLPGSLIVYNNSLFFSARRFNDADYPLWRLGASTIQSNNFTGGEVNVLGDLLLGAQAANTSMIASNATWLTIGGGLYIGYAALGSNTTAIIKDAGTQVTISSNLYVGYAAPRCSLIITNGAGVSAVNGYIGFLNSSSNNTLTVTGGTLVLAGSSSNGVLDVRRGTFLFQGGNVTVNRLILTNGPSSVMTFNAGTLISRGTTVSNSQNFVIGDSGSGGATFIANGGSHFVLNNTLVVGNSAPNNRLVITNSAQVVSGSGTVGSSSSNSVVITSSGVWSNHGNLVVGYTGNANSLTITNNGLAYCTSGSVGSGLYLAIYVPNPFPHWEYYYYYGNFNTATVAGSGSRWVVDGALTIGNYGYSNQLTVASGGSVTCSNLLIGTQSGVTGNKLTVTGGSLTVTNATATGVLEVRRGSIVCDSGTVTVDSLVAVNGSNSVIFLSGGTLNTKASSFSNAAPFVVGNGTNAANLHLLGGTHTFSGGLVVLTNAVVDGCGTIQASVINHGRIVFTACTAPAAPAGMFARLAASSSGLTIDGPVTNYATIVVQDGSSVTFTAPVINNGIIDQIEGAVTFQGGVSNNGLILNAAGDDDGDGLTNGWERAFGLNVLSAAGQDGAGGDPDGDGYTNMQEFIAGTSPVDAKSRPTINSIGVSGAAINVTAPSVAGKTYQLEYRDSLTSGVWSNVPSASQIGTGGIITLTDPSGATQPQRVYRIRISP